MLKFFKKKEKEPVRPIDPFATILLKNFTDDKNFRHSLVAVLDDGVRAFYDHTYVLILYSSAKNSATTIKVVRVCEENVEEFVTEVKKCETLDELKALDEKAKIFYD